jgi:putative glutamine amidotransferase
MKIAISVSEKEKARGQKSPYFQAMLQAGARAEELELVAASDSKLVGKVGFDGVLFTGGEDVDPAFYDETPVSPTVKVNHTRDEFELRLLERALEARCPILGICRGAQMINVGFGGSLYQDLKSAPPPPESEAPILQHKQDGSRSDATHSVTVTEPGSSLGAAITGNCRVNSLHHQAIKRLGRRLKVTAHAEDGLVEAVESADDYPFLLAVQWHPEEMTDRPEQRKIFEEFVAKCREAATKQTRKPPMGKF